MSWLPHFKVANNLKTIVTLNKSLYCWDYTFIFINFYSFDLKSVRVPSEGALLISRSLVLSFLIMSLVVDNLKKFPLCLVYDLAHILYSTAFIPFRIFLK